jgi:hypothetical protein
MTYNKKNLLTQESRTDSRHRCAVALCAGEVPENGIRSIGAFGDGAPAVSGRAEQLDAVRKLSQCAGETGKEWSVQSPT